MQRFFYDTNVFVYALGAEHPYRAPCREILRLAADGALRGEASTDLVQEFLHYRARRTGDRGLALETTRDVAALCKLHPLRPADLATALDLYGRHERLTARDAFFAAVAVNRGIEVILSSDKGFDGIDGLTRVDPLDEPAVAALSG